MWETVSSCRMDTFYEDFTNSLRTCVASRFYSSPLDKWSPQEIAAPERHKQLALSEEEDWDTAAKSLDYQNQAFGLLESMIRVYFTPDDVDDELDAEKEQVWLFAHHWLSTYYNFLLDTRAVSTDFYKRYHERFLEVLRPCLCVSATFRPFFQSLAMDWRPSLVVIPTSSPVVVPIVGSPPVVGVPTVVVESAVPAVAVVPAVAAVAAVPAPCGPSPPKRLVLHGPRGHNKTRKNLHN